MKVIKPGRPQKGWAKELTCTGSGNGGNGCTALLLVEADDIYETVNHCRDERDYYSTFRCLSCSVETDLSRLDRVDYLKFKRRRNK